jgi:hypothetical protein
MRVFPIQVVRLDDYPQVMARDRRAGRINIELKDSRSIPVRMCEFQKPDGWIAIPLRPMDSTEDGMEVEG